MDKILFSPRVFPILLITLTLLVHMASSAILTGQVIVPGAAPSVSNVNLHDGDGGTIQLTAGSDSIQLFCDAIVTDDNGFGDLNTSRGYIYNGSYPAASADSNERYDNGSCVFSSGSGKNINVNCSFWVQHEAINGTWTCNISVNDSMDYNGTFYGTNTIDELTAISIDEATIDFGTMSLGAESSAGNVTNVSNQGNVLIDLRVNGTDYTCGLGTIPVNNTRYSTADGNFASMSRNLTHDPMTDTGFDMGIEGIVTPDGTNVTKDEFWTIGIPFMVKGTCTNTVQITGTYGG